MAIDYWFEADLPKEVYIAITQSQCVHAIQPSQQTTISNNIFECHVYILYHS